jgi:hypothetical protein
VAAAKNIPSLVVDLAATLDVCACGALPGSCLERLTGPSRRPCCPGCLHHPELPHRWETTHQPTVCASWADGQGVPRGVACAGHWQPAVVGEWRAGLAAAGTVVVRPGGSRVRWCREGLSAAREHLEGLGPDPKR